MHEASRREKLRKLEELGVDPWGGRFDGHTAIGEIRARESEITVEPIPPGSDAREPAQHGPKVRAAGRIVLQRKKGKLIFVDIRDWTGQIQLFIGRGQVGEDNWALAECFDLGDIVGVDGELKRTKAGELTIFAEKLHFLTKSIEPPPEKHHGLTDAELRQRMRYLDLIYNEGVTARFVNRTRIVQSIRGTLASEGFLEIEGPTLHSIAGGAAARPFKTHHNALDIPLFLRIALELHLKRLLVGGMERVYELGRVYRNEGISPRIIPNSPCSSLSGVRRLPHDDGPDREAHRAGNRRHRPGAQASLGRGDDRFFAPVPAEDLRRAVRRACWRDRPTTRPASGQSPNRSALARRASTQT
jgi:lysyl-tRNA synthetase class 2